MATVVGTRLDVVLLAVRQQLLDRLGWPAERVLLIDPRWLTQLHPHGDQYLCLWCDTESVNRPILQGAGRYDARLSERIDVAVRTRLGTDEATSARYWLLDATLGHNLAKWNVHNALTDWVPVDADGNWLAVKALHPAGNGKPKLDRVEKEWGESTLSWELTYQLALTIPPAPGGFL